MKKVLIALDYNPSAQKIAEEGYALAKAMDAEVILVHATSDSSYYSAMNHDPIMGFPGFVNSTTIMDKTELKQKSLEYLEQSKKHLGDEKIKIEVAEGNTSDNILRLSQKMGVDIIVMGTHSRRWLEKILLGSVAEDVLRKTTIPVFIIPTKEMA